MGPEDLPNTVNARELQPFMARAQFDPGAIDARSRALVVAFQTWLGVQDEQVLIRLTDGRVSSTPVAQQGYFSLLRWASDPARDEARNVAVILVGESGHFGGLKAAPISSISPRLHDQGILDAMVVGLEKQFGSEKKPTLDLLERVRKALAHSVYLTEPQPVAVYEQDETLTALYRAYVAPRGGGSGATKGTVVDRVVATLRKRGLVVQRGHYLEDFIFDVVVEREIPLVLEVLSFASAARTWVSAEYDAGHFLYALHQVGVRGHAVVRPPSDTSHENARASHARALRWFEGAGVPVVPPEDVAKSLLPVAAGG